MAVAFWKSLLLVNGINIGNVLQLTLMLIKYWTTRIPVMINRNGDKPR